MKKKAIAFYLPQFHPIEENNEWWGPGFTEWTNVAAARPRYPSHHQPHIPGELGFYDLRLSDTRVAQAKLAREFGVYGFCYYHYWFNGRVLLDRPLNEVLRSGEPDFPFCVCWANENWTRAWDGLDRQVLMKQDYSEADSLAHIRYLLEIMKDSRYIRINNKPLLLIYRPDIIPDVAGVLANWRDSSKVAFGAGIHIAGVRNGFSKLTDKEYLDAGFDSIVDFQPNREYFPSPTTAKGLLKDLLQRWLPDEVYQYLKLSTSQTNRVSYSGLVDGYMKKVWPKEYIKFPCVFPSWDNTARRKSPTIIENSDFGLFASWLERAFENVSYYGPDEQIVFVNAWNEWAEGCHLEPDRKNGRGFLSAVHRVVTNNKQSGGRGA